MVTDHVARQQFIDGSAYPPGLTGLRGSHIGSFETAHAIRDGRRFDTEGIAPTDDEIHVVGGSGHQRARRGVVLPAADA